MENLFSPLYLDFIVVEFINYYLTNVVHQPGRNRKKEGEKRVREKEKGRREERKRDKEQVKNNNGSKKRELKAKP